MSYATVIKLCILNNDSSVRKIRKFFIRQHVLGSFTLFSEEIKDTYPELNSESFTLLWQDKANDEIVITNDNELKISLMEMDDPKYYIKLKSKGKGPSEHCKEQETTSHKKENVKHIGIVCDNCDKSITGFRYKCILCDDYDLCSSCESKGLHSHHFMIRIPQPLHFLQSRSLHHHLRKVIKKNSAHSCKKRSSNEHAFKNCQCVASCIENVPDLKGIIDVILEGVNYCSEPSKQPEKNLSRDYQTEKGEEPKKDANINDSASNKFPGEGKKLIESNKDDKGSVSDASDVSDELNDSGSQGLSKKKAVLDWTIVDKDEISEMNSAPSGSGGNTTSQTLYPTLPKEKKEIHHPDPIINKALETMIEMGFSNEDKLLSYLVVSLNGDINKVIEVLQSMNK